MRIATIVGSSFATLANEGSGGACAGVGAAPIRSASAAIPRNPLAQLDFMFLFAQTKPTTAALPAPSTLELSCSLAGASAGLPGPFENDSLPDKHSRHALFPPICSHAHHRPPAPT